MYRRSVLLTSVVVLLVGGLVGFVTPAWGGGTLTLATASDPRTLDPAVATSYESGIVTYNVYETLLKCDPVDYSIMPNLAVSWEISDDRRSAVFHLRKGVKFQDGSTFTAEAVKFSFERTRAIGRTPAGKLARIEKVEVIDEYTIKFTADKPWGFWEMTFACPRALPIVSPSYVKAHATNDDPWAEEWMHDHAAGGTGPYMVAEWLHGQRVKLIKFENYWKGWSEKNFDTVLIEIIREPAKQGLLVKAGEVDIVYDVPEDLLPALEADPNITVKAVSALASLYVPMKCHKGPLANKTVRKAITYAINYYDILEVNPYAVRAQGPIPRAALGHDDALPIYPYDPEVAKALLKAAGYAPGEIELKLVYVAGLEWERKIAAIIQQNLADIGIKVVLEKMPWATLFPLLSDPDKSPEMYIFYAAAFFADPYGIIWQTFSPAALGIGGYNNGYNNPKVGELLDLAEVTTDKEERAELYKELQRIIVADVPAIFVWDVPYIFVYRSHLKGIIPDRIYRVFDYYSIYRE